jgi:hypothetical protein
MRTASATTASPQVQDGSTNRLSARAGKIYTQGSSISGSASSLSAGKLDLPVELIIVKSRKEKDIFFGLIDIYRAYK